MPRRRKPAPIKQRSITVRPVYRDKPDTEALVRALIQSALQDARSTKQTD